MQDSIGAKIVPEEEDMQAPKGKKNPAQAKRAAQWHAKVKPKNRVSE
jgi:hypothetical protein